MYILLIISTSSARGNLVGREQHLDHPGGGRRRRGRVDDAAVEADLIRGAGLDVDVAHLDHGGGELLLPERLVGGEGVGERRERGVADELVVGEVEAEVERQQLVVVVVQHSRRADVDLRRVWVELAGAGRAQRLQQRLVRRADGPVGQPAAVGGQEGGAVGAADSVGARQHHHVLDGEVLPPEAVDEDLRRAVRAKQVGVGLRLVGHAAVPPPRGHLVEELARQVDAVAGGEGDDVGARDGARAAPLHGGLGGVDHVEAAQARVVRPGLTLRVAAGGVHG